MPNFNPEMPFGEKFTTDNDTQAGFLSLFVEFATAENPPIGEDLVSEIKEAMTPLYLVDPEISKKLPIYGKVKSFLERYNVQAPITQESGKLVAKRLICRIWHEEEFEEDRQEAFKMFDAFRGGSLSAPIERASEEIDNNGVKESARYNSRQIANDVAKRFLHEKTKFSGESTECWPKYLESFTRMAIEMELSNEMKCKLFHHLLRDHALEFYRDNVEGKVSSYQETIRKMNDEFCSSVKMEAIARKLEALHISQFLKTGCTEDEALKEMAKTIQDLTPQAPHECRTDRFRKNVLYNGTRGRDWALHISSSTNFLQLSYQQLLHELENSIQQHIIHSKYEEEHDADHSYRSDRIADTNFTGQGRYVFNRRYEQKNRKDSNKHANKCWNCGKLYCSVNKCPYPKNPKKIRINRIKHFEARNGRLDANVSEALFHFSEEYIDDSLSISSDSEEESDEESSNDSATAEIQHLLLAGIKNHKESAQNGLDF